jgi:hypothetical protein
MATPREKAQGNIYVVAIKIILNINITISVQMAGRPR